MPIIHSKIANGKLDAGSKGCSLCRFWIWAMWPNRAENGEIGRTPGLGED
jgi:hypothetical protein